MANFFLYFFNDRRLSNKLWKALAWNALPSIDIHYTAERKKKKKCCCFLAWLKFLILRIISEQQNNYEGDQFKIHNLWIFICCSHEFFSSYLPWFGNISLSLWPLSLPSNRNVWRSSNDSHWITSSMDLMVTIEMWHWDERGGNSSTGQLEPRRNS